MQLDLFLLSQMRDSDNLTELLRRAEIRPELLASAKREARAAGLLQGRRVPRDGIIRSFGLPMEANENVLRYGLEFWPEHLFEWGLDPDGNAFTRGFALSRPAMDLPKSCLITADLVNGPFRAGIHTMNEVERTLGSPSSMLGWGAMEDWVYSLGKGEDPVVFEFDFGLLVNIAQREPVQPL
jgi:hypothetical protein